jgi:putative SOS response-associated peptidase YedK
MFRHAIRKQRCLVPADAFIEGPKKERLNKPYVVYANNIDRPFAFAGIWDRWVNKDTGEEVDSLPLLPRPPMGYYTKLAITEDPLF